METTKLLYDEEPIIIEHLSKYRSLMPSLALIFHIIDVADGATTGYVSLQAAEKAAAWCDFLEQHARRIYGLVTYITPYVAQELGAKLEQLDFEKGFTIRDIYRKGWHLLDTKEHVQLACEELVKLGWLQEVTVSKNKAYLINPKVADEA